MDFHSPQWGEGSLSSLRSWGHFCHGCKGTLIFPMIIVKRENQEGTSKSWSSQTKVEVSQTLLLQLISHGFLPHCHAQEMVSAFSGQVQAQVQGQLMRNADSWPHGWCMETVVQNLCHFWKRSKRTGKQRERTSKCTSSKWCSGVHNLLLFFTPSL